MMFSSSLWVKTRERELKRGELLLFNFLICLFNERAKRVTWEELRGFKTHRSLFNDTMKSNSLLQRPREKEKERERKITGSGCQEYVYIYMYTYIFFIVLHMCIYVQILWE